MAANKINLLFLYYRLNRLNKPFYYFTNILYQFTRNFPQNTPNCLEKRYKYQQQQFSLVLTPSLRDITFSLL